MTTSKIKVCQDCSKEFRSHRALEAHRFAVHGSPYTPPGKPRPPDCPYCGSVSVRTTGASIYPERVDLALKVFYACHPCEAWVGCHPGTERPLGRLANAELRRAKSHAHSAFDPLWRRKADRGDCTRAQARRDGYVWLAGMMGLDPKDTHIGMFNVEQCQRVIEICDNVRRGRA